MENGELDLRKERARAGLCADCIHARVIDSERRTRFYLCELSKTNAQFARYPRLPVLECSGYKKTTD